MLPLTNLAHKGVNTEIVLLNEIIRTWLSYVVNTMVADALAARAAGLNIKTVLSTYGDFHVKDKTAVRTSYL